jgi:hypothetical protein
VHIYPRRTTELTQLKSHMAYIFTCGSRCFLYDPVDVMLTVIDYLDQFLGEGGVAVVNAPESTLTSMVFTALPPALSAVVPLTNTTSLY